MMMVAMYNTTKDLDHLMQHQMLRPVSQAFNSRKEQDKVPTSLKPSTARRENNCIMQMAAQPRKK